MVEIAGLARDILHDESIEELTIEARQYRAICWCVKEQSDALLQVEAERG
jgi:hypothetical protein